MIRYGKRLDWSVPATLWVDYSLIEEASSTNSEKDSDQNSIIEDNIDTLKRPYDSHVNLAAGRTNHMNYDNIYKTEVEPSEQQKVKGGLPRLSSAFIDKNKFKQTLPPASLKSLRKKGVNIRIEANESISRLFSKRSIAREGTLNLPLKVIGNNKSFASQ